MKTVIYRCIALVALVLVIVGLELVNALIRGI